MIQIFWFR